MKIVLTTKEILDILTNHIEEEYADLSIRMDSADLHVNGINGYIEFDAEVE